MDRSHARIVALLVVLPLLAALVVASPGRAASRPVGVVERLEMFDAQSTPKHRPSDATLAGRAPARGANPWTSLLSPEQAEDVDLAYWAEVARVQGRREARVHDRRTLAAVGGLELVYREEEPDELRGGNDTVDTAERLTDVGTGANDRQQGTVLGTLAPPPATGVARSREDDGSIRRANPLDLDDGGTVSVDARIGNGPHGTRDGDGSGDFDWFDLGRLRSGDVLEIDLDTPRPFDDLDPVVTVWDADGFPVAFNDDDGESLDSQLLFTVPRGARYYASIEGFGGFQEDPFDSGSGFGAGSEGTYTATFGRNAGDVDMFSVGLQPGDVLSASVIGAGGQVEVLGSGGAVLMGSTQDASFIYPADTLLTGGGRAVIDHVTDRRARYRVAVRAGSGDYELTLRVLRPGTESTTRRRQTVFLDFDGEELNTSIFFGPGVRRLSPLSAFMGRWGLSPDRTGEVVDVVVDTVAENLRRDLRRAGIAPDVDVRLRNSDDHPDPFGGSSVSRVVVGGSIQESGIPTIGIAQSIDPGNFGRTDTALVLLDVLSDPRGPFGDPSLNTYLRARSDRVGFVGRAIGNVVSHEIGHFVGNWHTEPFDGRPNLMEPGGDFPTMFGVGPDRIGGTADDVDIDFGRDRFDPFEGFTGREDTAVRTAWALDDPADP